MAKKWIINAECHKCGEFEVTRPARRRKSTSGQVSDRPVNVVCPTCRMWAEVVGCEEVVQ